MFASKRTTTQKILFLGFLVFYFSEYVLKKFLEQKKARPDRDKQDENMRDRREKMREKKNTWRKKKPPHTDRRTRDCLFFFLAATLLSRLAQTQHSNKTKQNKKKRSRKTHKK